MLNPRKNKRLEDPHPIEFSVFRTVKYEHVYLHEHIPNKRVVRAHAVYVIACRKAV